MDDIWEDRKNAILIILAALTKVRKKSHKKTQLKAREEIRKILVGSESMMNMFKKDCALANSRKGLSQTEIQVYYDYIYRVA